MFAWYAKLQLSTRMEAIGRDTICFWINLPGVGRASDFGGNQLLLDVYICTAVEASKYTCRLQEERAPAKERNSLPSTFNI